MCYLCILKVDANNLERCRNMKVQLRYDESDPTDTRFTVVLDGKRTGELSMSTVEAAKIRDIVEAGCARYNCDFESVGELYKSENFVVWHKRSGKDRRSGQERRMGQDRRKGQDRRDQ